MSMKLNLKLLAARFSQAKEEPPASEEGVNRYLLEQVLRPNLAGKLLRLGDIDFDAFDADDVPALVKLNKASRDLSQFAQTVVRVPPVAKAGRSFC